MSMSHNGHMCVYDHITVACVTIHKPDVDGTALALWYAYISIHTGMLAIHRKQSLHLFTCLGTRSGHSKHTDTELHVINGFRSLSVCPPTASLRRTWPSMFRTCTAPWSFTSASISSRWAACSRASRMTIGPWPATHQRETCSATVGWAGACALWSLLLYG